MVIVLLPGPPGESATGRSSAGVGRRCVESTRWKRLAAVWKPATGSERVRVSDREKARVWMCVRVREKERERG